uniref:Sieve element occlusion C-terminal domain-containing protein n=1 Tax=Quercus lobata TaxID=97700 RepID=A0A7N2LMS1_QUELO
MVTELDPMTKEIQKLLSYKNEKGWVVLCEAARLVFSGYGTTVLTVLKNFDEWRQCLKDSVSDFETYLEEHYNEQLFKDGFPCRVIDIPRSDGLIPDYRKCPDCSKIMETSFRFKCCDHNQNGFNSKFCHNHHGTKAQLKGSYINHIYPQVPMEPVYPKELAREQSYVIFSCTQSKSSWYQKPCD